MSNVADRVYLSETTEPHVCAECGKIVDPVVSETIVSTYYILRWIPAVRRQGLFRRKVRGKVQRRFECRGIYHHRTNKTGESWYCGPTELSAEIG